MSYPTPVREEQLPIGWGNMIPNTMLNGGEADTGTTRVDKTTTKTEICTDVVVLSVTGGRR